MLNTTVNLTGKEEGPQLASTFSAFTAVRIDRCRWKYLVFKRWHIDFSARPVELPLHVFRCFEGRFDDRKR